MTEYIEMTIEEALEYSRGNKSQVVLVAIRDLEQNSDVTDFVKKNKTECEDIIRNAETIARSYDDFISQLKVFTRKQIDLKNIKPYGKESTLLYHVKG
ncbi:MAG: hypothetical protein NC489_36755 [Ruminococcus flavefaciens]|nr:hypothetical protein [Ruminococcus flavefaciens]